LGAKQQALKARNTFSVSGPILIAHYPAPSALVVLNNGYLAPPAPHIAVSLWLTGERQ